MTTQKSIKIFISYAHEDEFFKNELVLHLKPLLKLNKIAIWDDGMMMPGQSWEQEIKHQLNQADIILFLVSADFMASAYESYVEGGALDRSRKREAIIVPVIIRPTDYSYLDIGKYQALPKDGQPISTWTNQEEAWLDVVQQLQKLVDALEAGKIELVKKRTQNGVSKNRNASFFQDISQIKDFVSIGKTKEAISLLLKVSKETHQEDIYNSAILLSSIFNNVQRNETKGIIGHHESQISQSQITSSILSTLNEIQVSSV